MMKLYVKYTDSNDGDCYHPVEDGDMSGDCGKVEGLYSDHARVGTVNAAKQLLKEYAT